MKNNYLLPLGMIAVAATLIFQSNASGPASNGTRATGAPGDGGSTCITCHSGGSFGNVNIGFSIETDSGNAVTEYVPGETYSLQVGVTASSGNPSGYGFQMIALEDNGNVPTNSFVNAGPGVKLSTTAGRQYAEQNALNAFGVFEVDWVAPSAGAGDITFYIGANAVNGNGINSGDNANLFDLTITEVGGDTTDTTGNGDPNGIGVVEDMPILAVFPNPADGFIHVKGVDPKAELYIFSVTGQQVRSVQASERVIQIDDLESGLYVITDGQRRSRFLKR